MESIAEANLIKMKRLLLLIAIIWYVDGKKKLKPTLEDIHEYSTDESVVFAKPVVINARKMHKALKNPDVVSTCRYILFKTYKTFHKAKESCEKLQMPLTHTNASIAVIKTREDNKDITHLLQLAYGVKQVGRRFDRRNWVWVGLKKVHNTGKVLKKNKRGPKNFNASEWRWDDGSIPEYVRWLRDMPDQEKAGKNYQDHVSVSKRGRWDDTFPYKKMPYACNYCGKYIVLAQQVTWFHARSLCKSYGLTMAMVNSKRDNDDLAMAVKMEFGEDTEKKRWDDNNWVWLGSQEIMQNGTGTKIWQHHDGSPLLWVSPKWDTKRQPDNWSKQRWGEERVVAFSRINHKWDDSYPERKRPFACMCPHMSCESNVYHH